MTRPIVILTDEANELLDAAVKITGRSRKDLASEAITAKFTEPPAADLVTTTPAQLAAELAAAVPFRRVAMIRLGEPKNVPPDADLGNRTEIGWSAAMSDIDVAWATAGHWRVRPDLEYLAGVAAGRVRVVLRTDLDHWCLGDDGRAFHPRPVLLTDAAATDVLSGEPTEPTMTDRSIFDVLHDRDIQFTGGARNPVHRL